MFSDSPVEVTGVKVTSEIMSKKSESDCQTDKLIMSNKEIQNADVKSIQSQTNQLSTDVETSYNVQNLAAFLKRVYTGLMNELGEIEEVPASVNVIGDEKQDAKHELVKKLPTMGKSVSCITISSGGTFLAIAYREPVNYESWCTHEGIICVHSIEEENFSGTAIYSKVTSSCPRIICFSPKKPDVLVGGLSNGEIVIWCLDEDEFIVKTRAEAFSHSDTVTTMFWPSDGSCFISGGKDGKIIFWSLAGSQLKGITGYQINSNYSAAKATGQRVNSEILAMSFWWSGMNSEFITAVRGGMVLHCSAGEKVQESISGSAFANPVVMNYEPHMGIVTCVKCMGDDMFVTCGMNSEIHIYQKKVAAPFYVIQTDFALFGVDVINYPQKLIACWGSSPNIYFYRTDTFEKTNDFIEGNDEDPVITAVAFKSKSRLVFTGSRKGNIILWSRKITN